MDKAHLLGDDRRLPQSFMVANNERIAKKLRSIIRRYKCNANPAYSLGKLS